VRDRWENGNLIPIIVRLLEEGGGRFSRQKLEEELGNNYRRLRHALYEARKSGINLVAVRNGGHAVVEYVQREKAPPKNGWKTREEYNLP